MENVGKSKKVLDVKEVKKAPGETEKKDERVLEEAEGGKEVRIEAFPSRKFPPTLEYDALKYSNRMKIVDAKKVDTVYGERKVVIVELLQSGNPAIRKGLYTLWCSRLGLERVFEELGNYYDDPRGLVIELRENGKVGRAYNYILTVLREG